VGLFSVNEACAVSGVHPQTLRNWCAAGLLRPAQPGTTGTGRGHRFSLAQVFALAAGMLYRREGAAPDRVAGVVRLLAGMPGERLEAHLREGETFPVPAVLLGDAPRPDCWLPGLLIRPPYDDPSLSPGAAALMRRLDLGPLWEKVVREADRLSRRPAQKAPGRRPGRSGARRPSGKREQKGPGGRSLHSPAPGRSKETT
jgi:hypothetical protein